ncbi:MAG: cytochrome c oxidase subunit [Actinomycetota bacterium]|jgi:cytochrome c oxidase subunit 3|nr:cytochrome c oxidase subunit [Actinomycetota bacterium]
MSETATSTFAVDQRAAKGSSSSVLGMTLFVASEAMFFAAFFGAYFTIYAATAVWPPLQIPIPSITVSAVATALLVISGFTLSAGVGAARKGRLNQLNVWLAVTIVLGLAFLILQAYDYSNTGFSIHDGTYASLFYIMTGLHMAHVIGGVLFLILVFVQSRAGEFSIERHDPVRASAIYWHFVDIVWVGLFVIFYLLPQGGS